jgi:hypothetical protein
MTTAVLAKIKASFRQPVNLIAGVLLALYILINVPTPAVLAEPISSIYGRVLLGFVAVVIFLRTNPLLGVLSAIAIYYLIVRSSMVTGQFFAKHFLPSEKLKLADFKKFNDFPVTLEEEVVSQMAPLVKYDAPSSLDYKPILDDTYDAAPVMYDGVI